MPKETIIEVVVEIRGGTREDREDAARHIQNSAARIATKRGLRVEITRASRSSEGT